MNTFLPRPWLVNPQCLDNLGPLHLDPLPAPPPVAHPKRLVSHDLFVDMFTPGPLDDLVRDLNERIAAEAARLRRLLPPAPAGYEWRAELNVEEDLERFRIVSVARVRYRLVAVDSAA